jgi:hypothetical protein
VDGARARLGDQAQVRVRRGLAVDEQPPAHVRRVCALVGRDRYCRQPYRPPPRIWLSQPGGFIRSTQHDRVFVLIGGMDGEE